MSLLRRLTYRFDRRHAEHGRPPRFTVIERLLPLVPLFGAILLGDVFSIDRHSRLFAWAIGLSVIVGLALLGWIIWRRFVATGATSTRRSERVHGEGPGNGG